ncbi:MAG: hypothetical protein L3J65_03940 [Robiginitomaculum sp.]|nr:hypothetical protein [Robiginitomaculum sp.]
MKPLYWKLLLIFGAVIVGASLIIPKSLRKNSHLEIGQNIGSLEGSVRRVAVPVLTEKTILPFKQTSKPAIYSPPSVYTYQTYQHGWVTTLVVYSSLKAPFRNSINEPVSILSEKGRSVGVGDGLSSGNMGSHFSKAQNSLKQLMAQSTFFRHEFPNAADVLHNIGNREFLNTMIINVRSGLSVGSRPIKSRVVD